VLELLDDSTGAVIGLVDPNGNPWSMISVTP
jgi:hypothetical protein